VIKKGVVSSLLNIVTTTQLSVESDAVGQKLCDQRGKKPAAFVFRQPGLPCPSVSEDMMLPAASVSEVSVSDSLSLFNLALAPMNVIEGKLLLGILLLAIVTIVSSVT